MHRLARLLLILAVFLCGSHLAEASELQAGFAQVQCSSAADCTPQNGERSDLPDGGHHHCPVAPDLFAPAGEPEIGFVQPVHFAFRAAILHSLSQAPPLEPPAA